VEPRLGYVAGLLLGVGAIAAAFAISATLPLGEERKLLVPVALSTVIIGLMVLTTRSKAVVQVVGYVMLENGVYLFGLIHVERVPFLVEVGVLLDVFVAVFIMGIVVFHISREFDTLDTARLTELTD
jgi:hydrogenase-4 component E